MIAGQREAIDELVVKMRIGRIKRRTFLERAVKLGLSFGAALSLLEACGDNSVMITWESEHLHDPVGIYNLLVDQFNKDHAGSIYVRYVNGPVDSGQQHDAFVNMLQARKGDVDVMSMDVIWPAEFAAHQWTVPIDHRWPAEVRAQYLQSPIDACTFNHHIWAVPHRTDAGLIYYRTDLVSTPPQTWDEMTELAQHLQGQGRSGYLWQGAQYEGLVCNFVEVLYSHGGMVLDPANPKQVVVKSPEAQQALARMVQWVGSISPAQVTTFKEEEARLLWQNDQAVFMRNWPYAYSLGNDASTSRIAGKFNVHSMLHSGASQVGHSCIGGWQLGINAFSRQPDAAWKFIEYMISPAAQKRIALEASLFTTLKRVYDDAEVIKKNPFFKNFKEILLQAKPRPVSPHYPAISNTIQSHVHNALVSKADAQGVARILISLQNDLQSIVAK